MDCSGKTGLIVKLTSLGCGLKILELCVQFYKKKSGAPLSQCPCLHYCTDCGVIALASAGDLIRV